MEPYNINYRYLYSGFCLVFRCLVWMWITYETETDEPILNANFQKLDTTLHTKKGQNEKTAKPFSAMQRIVTRTYTMQVIPGKIASDTNQITTCAKQRNTNEKKTCPYKDKWTRKIQMFERRCVRIYLPILVRVMRPLDHTHCPCTSHQNFNSVPCIQHIGNINAIQIRAYAVAQSFFTSCTVLICSIEPNLIWKFFVLIQINLNRMH